MKIYAKNAICRKPSKFRALSRKHSKSINYVQLLDYQCSHPECESGYDVEGHHIIPIKFGGEDAYWNLVSLCHKCHRERHFHSDWEEHSVGLFTWKCMKELEFLGFILDEREPDFQIKYTELLHKKRIANQEIPLDEDK